MINRYDDDDFVDVRNDVEDAKKRLAAIDERLNDLQDFCTRVKNGNYGPDDDEIEAACRVLGITRDDVDEILESKEKCEESDPWPQDGAYYYYFNLNTGRVQSDVWWGTEFDITLQYCGNIFKTYDEALFELHRRETIEALKVFAEPRNGYYDLHCFHYHIVYCNGKLAADCTQDCRLGDLTFESEFMLNRAVEHAGIQNVIKYYLGIDE